jgi:hypothetical protein
LKKDQAKKTRTFIVKGLKLWAILIVIFLAINFYINRFGDMEIENDQSGFLAQLNGIIFTFGVCGIPIILFCSVVLKFAKKAIDKIGGDKD